MHARTPQPPRPLPGFHDLPTGWLTAWRWREPPAPDPSPAVLRELRDARFPAGLCCPHCRSGRVQRWGAFSGRQRYRCRDCGRTSSDLTGTPLAYSKRPELWGEFAGCMLESLSVRAAGRRLGIDKDTAWRWRHALLDAHAALPRPALKGLVEICGAALPLNRKGERLQPWEWAPRRRRRKYGVPNPTRVWLLFARDRTGRVESGVSPFGPPTRSHVSELLGSRPRGLRTILHPHDVRACGAFAIPKRIPCLCGSGRSPQRGSLLHLQNVLGFQRRFRIWLKRFHGVGTWYLPNYLHWYAVLEDLARPAGGLLLDACRGPFARVPRQRPGAVGGSGDAADRHEPGDPGDAGQSGDPGNAEAAVDPGNAGDPMRPGGLRRHG